MKLPAGGDSRDEVRLPLGRATRPPAELAALVRVYTRGDRLAPVAELRTRRRRWRLSERSGRPVAELVDDHVVSHVPGSRTIGQSWREVEVEVELAEGAEPSVLDEIEKRLLPLGVRPARVSSKLARVLADHIPDPERTASPVRAG